MIIVYKVNNKTNQEEKLLSLPGGGEVRSKSKENTQKMEREKREKGNVRNFNKIKITSVKSMKKVQRFSIGVGRSVVEASDSVSIREL